MEPNVPSGQPMFGTEPLKVFAVYATGKRSLLQRLVRAPAYPVLMGAHASEAAAEMECSRLGARGVFEEVYVVGTVVRA